MAKTIMDKDTAARLVAAVNGERGMMLSRAETKKLLALATGEMIAVFADEQDHIEAMASEATSYFELKKCRACNGRFKVGYLCGCGEDNSTAPEKEA